MKISSKLNPVQLNVNGRPSVTAAPTDKVELSSSSPKQPATPLAWKILKGAAAGTLDGALHFGVTGGKMSTALLVDGGVGAAVGGLGGLFLAGAERAACSSNKPHFVSYTALGVGGGAALGMLHGALLTEAANLCGGGLMGAAISGAALGAVSAFI